MDSWEVKAIKFVGAGMWKVWWVVGGVSIIHEHQLDGVDIEYREYGRCNQDSLVILDVTHIRRQGNSLKGKTLHNQTWNTVQDTEILPTLLAIFDQLPDEQQARGVAYVVTRGPARCRETCYGAGQ